jgi:hypothetical protein
MEHNNDLIRLCALMYKKNELQAMRHTARKREARFADHLYWKKRYITHDPDGPIRASKKLMKKSISELKMLVREAHIANELAKLEIGKFTFANRKEMNAICRRNGWYVCTDGHSAYYNGVGYYNEDRSRFTRIFSGRDQVASIGAMQLLEEAMVCD